MIETAGAGFFLSLLRFIYQMLPSLAVIRVEIKSLEYQSIRNGPQSSVVVISSTPTRYLLKATVSHLRGRKTTIRGASLKVNDTLRLDIEDFQSFTLQPGEMKEVNLVFPVDEDDAIQAGNFKFHFVDIYGKKFETEGHFGKGGQAMSTGDKTDLHKQIIEFFPSYYTTLTSIIQATSLAYLFYVVSELLSKSNTPRSFYVLLFFTFLVIMEIWYEYMMGSAALRWLPNIWDSLLPFLFGLAQFFLIFSIASRRNDWWYFSLTSTCVLSLWAYQNMYSGARKLNTHEPNNVVLKSLGKFPLINEIWTAAYAVTFLIFGFCEQRGFPNLGFLITSIILFLLFIGKGIYYWRLILR